MKQYSYFWVMLPVFKHKYNISCLLGLAVWMTYDKTKGWVIMQTKEFLFLL